MWPNPQETADLVTFTEETLNGKLHFLCSAYAQVSNHVDFFYCGGDFFKNWANFSISAKYRLFNI